MRSRKSLVALSCALAITAAAPRFASAADTWTGTFSNDWDDGRNWSDGVPPGSNDDAYVAGSPTFYGAIVNNLTVAGTLTLDANSAYVSLVTFNTLTLSGNLQLEESNGNRAGVAALGALNIQSGGNLSTLSEPGSTVDDFSTLQGVVNNSGILDLNAKTFVNSDINNNNQFYAGGGTFFTTITTLASISQNAGMLYLNDNTNILVLGGTFNFNGGTIQRSTFLNEDGSNPSYQGTITIQDGTLAFGVSDAGGAVINSTGALTLTTNVPTGAYVNAVATSIQGSLPVSVPDTFINNGNIFFTLNGGIGAQLNTASNAGVIINYGTILSSTSDLTNCVLAINSPFVNYGTFSAFSDVTFNNNVSNEGTFDLSNGNNLMYTGRFNQDAGTLGDSGDEALNIFGGGFNFNGGVVHATVYLYSGYLSTAVANAQGTVFNGYNQITLNGDLAPGAILNVIAPGPSGPSYLYVQDGATNHGLIRLLSSSGYGIDIHIGDDTGTFHNAGTLTFSPDSSTSNSVYGNLNNAGKINVNGYVIFNGDVINNGTFSINYGGFAQISDNQTLYQNGTLEINGTLSLGTGARIIPFGTFTLNVGGQFSYPSSLNVGSGANVEVQGVGASLAVQGDLTVAGRIVSQGAGNIVSQGAGNIYVAADGTLIAQDGGNIVGHDGGSLIAQDGSTMYVLGTGSAGASLVGHDGASVVVAAAGYAHAAAIPDSAPGIPGESVVIQSGGTINLGGGTLFADNMLEVDAGGLLAGYGTANVTNAVSAGNISASNGTMTFNAPLTTTGGTLGGGTGLLLLNAGLTISANTALKGPVQTTSLTLGGTAGNWTTALDLQNAPLILEPTADTKAAALATLQDQLAAGAGHTVGIFSSTLAANMVIVLVDNAVWNQTTFRGATLDANALLAVPAAFGDATLDGRVDLNDLNTVLNNLGTISSLWTSGNFDGAPTIDFNDLNDVLHALGTSYATSGSVVAAEALLHAQTVPEPASIALLFPLAMAAFRRTRRSTPS